MAVMCDNVENFCYVGQKFYYQFIKMFLETHKAISVIFNVIYSQKKLRTSKTILKDKLTETHEQILDAGLCSSKDGSGSENATFSLRRNEKRKSAKIFTLLGLYKSIL
jgi:hypothetical protein